MDAVMTSGERVGALAQHFEFKGLKCDIKGISLTEIPYYFDHSQFIAKKSTSFIIYQQQGKESEAVKNRLTLSPRNPVAGSPGSPFCPRSPC